MREVLNLRAYCLIQGIDMQYWEQVGVGQKKKISGFVGLESKEALGWLFRGDRGGDYILNLGKEEVSWSV